MINFCSVNSYLKADVLAVLMQNQKAASNYSLVQYLKALSLDIASVLFELDGTTLIIRQYNNSNHRKQVLCLFKLLKGKIDCYNYNRMTSKKVKIAHDYEELEDQLILTLKDRPILVNGGIDEEEDLLQNDELQQTNEARYNTDLKSKLKNIANASTSHLEAKFEGNTDLLPHYNDYAFKPKTLQVEQSGHVNFKKGKKTKKLGSDYLQSDTTTSKLNAQYKAKSKGLQQKTSSKQLLSFLEQTAQDNLPTFKRKLQADEIITNSIDILRKKRMTENQIKSIVKDSHVDLEEESMLLKSIEQTRRKLQQQKTKFNILDAIKQEQDEQNVKHDRVVQIQLNPIAYKSSEDARHGKNIQVREALSGTASVVHMRLPSERLHKPKQELPQSFKEITKEQLQKMRDQVKFLQDKALGTGLAGALEFLRENALLGKQEQVGRYNDKNFQYNDPNDRIKLQYRNASGKLMKPKEAYRYICHKFHGQGPSKNTIQKAKKRELQEIRMKQRINSGGQLLQLLQKHQNQSGQAHMVLNIGSKPTK